MTVGVEVLDIGHPNVCGAMGCHEPIDEVVNHPDRGEIYVCGQHAEPYPTVRDVRQEVNS